MDRPPDLRVLALGAGVQSSTLYLLAATGALPERPDVAIFADTQDEGPWVYEHLAWLERAFGAVLPIRRATRGSLKAQFLRSRDQRHKCSSIPFFVAAATGSPTGIRLAKLRRNCTSDYKIAVIRQEIRRLVGLGPKRIAEWVGISTDEAHRAKPSRYVHTTTRWPLLDLGMSRADCIEWLQGHGFPVPEKSACVYCPFHDDSTWAWMQREKPEQFAEAVELDLEMRRGPLPKGVRYPPFVHRSLRPLGEIDFQALATNAGDQLELTWGEECEGMCGV